LVYFNQIQTHTINISKLFFKKKKKKKKKSKKKKLKKKIRKRRKNIDRHPTRDRTAELKKKTKQLA